MTFRVEGDRIYYDGLELAVVTARLSGKRMTALEKLNGRDCLTPEDAETMLAELMADVITQIRTAWPDEDEKAIKALFRRACVQWVRP